MRKFSPLLLVFLAFIGVKVEAQQLPHFSDFERTRGYFNPAYHSSQKLSSTVQTQFGPFHDFQGLVNAQMGFYKGGDTSKARHVVGVSYLHDEIGIQSFDELKFNLGHRFETKNIGSITLGVAASVDYLTMDFTKAVTFTPGDPAVPLIKDSKIFLNLDFGVFYQTKNERGELGVASQKLLGRMIQIGGSGIFNYTPVRHYSAFATYLLSIGKKWSLKPALSYQTESTTHILALRAGLLKSTGLQFGLQYSNNIYMGGYVRSPNLNAFGGALNFNVLAQRYFGGGNLPSPSMGFQLGVSYALPN